MEAMNAEKSGRPELWLLLGCVLTAAALEAMACLIPFRTDAYTHIYYLLIILVALFFYRRTVIFGIYLAIIHIITYIFTGGMPLPDAFFRASLFILVSLLTGYLIEMRDTRQNDLIAYVTRLAIRRQSPVGRAESVAETPAGRAIRSMESIGDIQGLIRALENHDVEYRYRATVALGRLGDPATVVHLAPLLHDPDSGVRWEAAVALSGLGPAALGPLTEAMHDMDDDLRWKAAVALGDIRNPAAVECLTGALAEGDEYVRGRVISSLAHQGSAAIGPLTAAFELGDEWVRDGAVSALAAMKGPEAAASFRSAGPSLQEAVRLVWKRTKK